MRAQPSGGVLTMTTWKKLRYIAVGVIMLVAVGSIGSSAAFSVGRFVSTEQVCAEFTDTVGLYPGNSVTMLGVEVGSVERIDSLGNRMRVTMEIDSGITLPADVGAVTMSDSIVTNRHVELFKPYTGGPKFDSSTCIPLERTRTPLGVSETFDALGKLTGELLGGRGTEAPGRPANGLLADTLANLQGEFAGTGPAFNSLLEQLSTVVGDPARGDAVLRRLIDNLDTLATMFVTKWPDMQAVLDNLHNGLQVIGGVSDHLAQTIDLAVDLLPVLVRNVEKYDQQAYAILDLVVPITHHMLGSVDDIAELLSYLPAVLSGVKAVFDPAAQAVKLNYSPPRFEATVNGEQTTADIVDLLTKVGGR